MAETENKSILSIPYLRPERRYDSEGIIPVITESPQKETTEEEEPLLDILEGLERVYRLSDLLPSGLSTIIKEVTRTLSEDTQGKIIQNIRRKQEETPETPVVPSIPEISEPQKRDPWDTTREEDQPLSIDREGETPTIPRYSRQTPIGSWQVSPTQEQIDSGEYVTDIFSREPIFTIVANKMDSLIDISRNAYLKDDADIKEHYISKMTELSHRFFQVMSTIASEAGMPDHSYLMQDFDGTAVKTSDPNLQHLIDDICKNQVVYDQKERFMRKTHTAQNTLIHLRSMTSSEAQRERYLGEEYQRDQSYYAASFSNDLLEKSRAKADDNYKESAYGLYKYLDSATKLTNTMLNMKIDEGIAKAGLALTGSDIYAFTPPPPPTMSNIDDGYKSTSAMEQQVQNAINTQGMDSTSGDSYGGSGSSGTVGIPEVSGLDAANKQKIFNAFKAAGYDDIAVCGLMGRLEAEHHWATDFVELHESHIGTCGGLGIAQWQGSRIDKIKNWITSNGGDIGSLDWQVKAVIWEAGEHYGMPALMNGQSSATAACNIWTKHYEGGNSDGKDIDYAEGFYQEFVAKKKN